MADDKTDQNDNSSGTDDAGKGDAEKKFFDRIGAEIDAGVDRAVQKYLKPAEQRTGRTTITGVLADLMFGKAAAKDDDKK